MELGDTGIGKREKLREVNENKEDEIRQRVVGVFLCTDSVSFVLLFFLVDSLWEDCGIW